MRQAETGGEGNQGRRRRRQTEAERGGEGDGNQAAADHQIGTDRQVGAGSRQSIAQPRLPRKEASGEVFEQWYGASLRLFHGRRRRPARKSRRTAIFLPLRQRPRSLPETGSSSAGTGEGNRRRGDERRAADGDGDRRAHGIASVALAIASSNGRSRAKYSACVAKCGRSPEHLNEPNSRPPGSSPLYSKVNRSCMVMTSPSMPTTSEMWVMPLVGFMVAKLCLPFVFGAAAFRLIDVLGFGNVRPPLRSLVPLMAVGLGAYAPDIFIRNAIQKRQKAIQKGLPDALDLLIICAEAGLSLDAAMTRVAREMERRCPEVAEEFGLMAIELGFLPDRRQALVNLTRRCPLPSMRGVVNTLLQTEEYGTPLAKALRVLSTEFRTDGMMKAEEKAARLPAVLTVPMIVFILPVLMIVLVGPAALRVIDAFRSM